MLSPGLRPARPPRTAMASTPLRLLTRRPARPPRTVPASTPSRLLTRSTAAAGRRLLTRPAATATDAPPLPPGFRDYPSPLPPTRSRPTTLGSTPAAPGVWWLTQPFTPAPWTSFSAENRAVVVALPDTSLLLINPLPPTPEFNEHVANIVQHSGCSRITHVVAPSTSPEHWCALPDVLRDCPAAAGATVWVPPGFFDGRRIGARFIARAATDALKLAATWRELPLDGGAPAAWGGGIDVATLRAPGGVTESAFRVRSARVAVTADTAFGLAESDAVDASALDRFSARVAGIYGRVGCALAPVVLAAGSAGRTYADTLASWRDSVDTLVPLHLSAPWTDGGARLADALAFARTKKEA